MASRSVGGRGSAIRALAHRQWRQYANAPGSGCAASSPSRWAARWCGWFGHGERPARQDLSSCQGYGCPVTGEPYAVW
jgi:hypothetical protein